MVRRLLLTVLSVPVLGTPLAAQRPAAPARVRPRAAAAATDTTRRDTTAAASDPISKFLESFTYRTLGPAAYSGRVTAIAVPKGTEPRPKTFYIGAAGGGVWKTTNGGVTWQSVSSGLGSETVGDLAVAPSHSTIAWGGTGEKNSLRPQDWGTGCAGAAVIWRGSARGAASTRPATAARRGPGSPTRRKGTGCRGAASAASASRFPRRTRSSCSS